MGFLLLLIIAFSYSIIKYLGYEEIIKKSTKNRIIYYLVLIPLIIMSNFLMEDNTINLFASTFFIFAIISSLEYQIIYKK